MASPWTSYKPITRCGARRPTRAAQGPSRADGPSLASARACQGVYVIHDNAFRLISAISDAPGRSAAEEAPRYAVIAVGYIRGFLANLGYSSSVDLDTVAPPSCRFRITIH